MFDETVRARLLTKHHGSALGGFVLAGTGHRLGRLGGYGEDVKTALTELASQLLIRVRPDRVVSGMALGWDQALAEAAVAHKIPFTAAVPFEGQEHKWPEESQRRYHELLRQARDVQTIGHPGFSAKKMQVRNIYMVHECTALATLWDGKQNGGTWNCVRYARRVKKPRINMWNTWKELRLKAAHK